MGFRPTSCAVRSSHRRTPTSGTPMRSGLAVDQETVTCTSAVLWFPSLSVAVSVTV